MSDESTAGSPEKPTLCQGVEYLDPTTGKQRAAVVSEVIEAENELESTLVGLHVFEPAQQAYFASNVSEHRGSGPQDPGTWRWPVRA